MAIGSVDGVLLALVYTERHNARHSILALKARAKVTIRGRRDVHIDRIASAWLIRRFVDPAGVFKFVDGKHYDPLPGELRFDMANAEFTHEGNDWTFETLIPRTELEADPALRAIADIIHDLDIEDGRFGRPETVGFGAMISGVCTAANNDDERIKLGTSGLDQFYAYFRKPWCLA